MSGTFEPRSSGPRKDENPDFFHATHQTGTSQGTALVFPISAKGGEAPGLQKFRLGRLRLMVGLAGEGKDEQTLCGFQLWAINPFITNHLVNDESV